MGRCQVGTEQTVVWLARSGFDLQKAESSGALTDII